MGDFQPGHDYGGGDIGPNDPTGHDNSRPTTAQIQATVDLMIWLDFLYEIKIVEGHYQI